MAKCAKAFLRNKNRVFLKGDVLTTLARHSHKASAKACAGDSFMKDASSLGSRAGYPEGRPNPVRNTRTAKYCSCAQNLSMPIFGVSYHIRNVPGLSTIEMSPGYHAGEKAGVFIFCQPCLQG